MFKKKRNNKTTKKAQNQTTKNKKPVIWKKQTTHYLDWKLHHWQMSKIVAKYVVSTAVGLRPLQKKFWANSTMMNKAWQVRLLLHHNLILGLIGHNSALVFIQTCVSLYISDHITAIHMRWLNQKDLRVITDVLPKKKWERSMSTMDKIWVEATLSSSWKRRKKKKRWGRGILDYKKAKPLKWSNNI